ncbi:MAG: mechanosensitive ion channel family protein [Acidimicrobiales bacterium]|nr:MAG: mechanosensitive ion channel family protein [Acidimicrobiales bacterium]
MMMDPAGQFAQSQSDIFVDDAITRSDWIQAAAILLISIVVAFVVAKLLRRLIAHGIGPGFASIVMARLVSYIVVLVGLFYTLTTVGVRVGPLLGALGLGGLVLALALQGLVESFVGSIILQARRPFTIGDTVELDGSVGIVEDIDSRTTLLRALDGTHVRIPNGTVVASTIVNITREPIRRSALDVGVAYDTDLELARATLESAIGRVPRVLDDPPATINVTGFDDSSIGFRILYWHASDVPSELACRSDLTVAVHQALGAEAITIAFPQVVVWSGVAGPGPYISPPGSVEMPYPGLDAPGRAGRRRRGAQLRRPGRRKTEQ